MRELSITLKIADRLYKMPIKIEDEEKFRKASRNIEERMKAYADAYSYKDKQDLLAMVSLELELELDKANRNIADLDEQATEKLKGINDNLDMMLKNINDL